MLEFGLPVLFTLILWWFSTGLIAFLDGLPRHTFRWSLAGATVLAAGGAYALVWSAGEVTVTGAFVAFTGAVLIWGWNEIAFLLGVVTGPMRDPCPPGCTGWKRFVLAVRAILWHELAILVTAVLVLALTWEAPNQVGAWTFLLLWVMRVSAKLNVFLGVPNLQEEFLPDHLAYMASFFRRRPMNLLFPLSVTAATIAVMLFAQAALAAEAGSHAQAGFALLAAFTSLALLEHWLMVLPLPASNLWAMYLGSRLRDAPTTPPRHGTNLAPSTLWRRS